MHTYIRTYVRTYIHTYILLFYSGGVGGSDYSHALTKLTDPSGISSPISLSSVMYSSSSRLEFGSEFEPISDQELDSVLNVRV